MIRFNYYPIQIGLLALLLGACMSENTDPSVIDCDPCTSPLEYEGLQLVFQEEFQSSLSSENWIVEEGDGCPSVCDWGNNELQYYREQNVEVINGNLVVTAKKEDFGGKEYTSGRINTRGNFEFTTGRIDIRAKMPKGQGMWPGLWLLGSNILDVTWAEAGQVVIAQLIGGNEDGRDNTIVANIFWENNEGEIQFDAQSNRLRSGIYNDKFVVFSLIKNETEVRWLINDIEFHRVNITGPEFDPIKNPSNLIISLAVGGDSPGAPDETTQFPQKLEIDYIRVFE
ncbi:glycoside hydrolase family 16 protein [Pararhodonellum marinum]|uniref:glycoside hydrolase family 16 protein n=1 Tax=Pararhodonellum marinum TaxID=2755358 RepID=UPI00188DE443|nr:glycoside hydrolase family 16 protein [Pararhodonellum marinum]